MDYEKAYKEALERAKGVIEQNPLMEYLKKGIEYIFPELKESEDERIRKGIIRNLEYLADRAEGFVKDELKERIAWLEKQGEQKPIISNNALREGITHFGITQYQIDNWLKKYVDVEKQGEQKIKTPEESLGIDSDTYNKIVDECVYGEQKPAWSEEDEKQARQIERIVHDDGCSQKLQKQIADWFKSLKERCNWKPSDEQMEALEHFVRSIGESGYASPYDNNTKVLYSLLSDLKKLKDEK